MSKGSGSAKAAPSKGAKRAAGGGWYQNTDLGIVKGSDATVYPGINPTSSRPVVVSRFGNDVVLGSVQKFPTGSGFKATLPNGKTASAMSLSAAKSLIVNAHNKAVKAAKKKG